MTMKIINCSPRSNTGLFLLRLTDSLRLILIATLAITGPGNWRAGWFSNKGYRYGTG